MHRLSRSLEDRGIVGSDCKMVRLRFLRVLRSIRLVCGVSVSLKFMSSMYY